MWFYISETQEAVAFFAPDETERNVVAIAFDQQGVVKSVRQLGLDDGENVAFSEKATPTAGHNMSIIEQMVGNIGRFNAGEDKKGGSMQVTGSAGFLPLPQRKRPRNFPGAFSLISDRRIRRSSRAAAARRC